jgi:type II secretory ATPase GspE/PulE/Tfp pilus assembly ATPase PilB-like protein
MPDSIADPACDVCRQTGYRGRVPVYELMSWSEALSTAFIGGASREELTYVAVEGGMTTMLADGVRKAAQGETTIEEVQRVLGVCFDVVTPSAQQTATSQFKVPVLRQVSDVGKEL